MAVPYFRARYLGTFVSGEQWSVNPTFAPLVVPTPPTQAQMQDWAEQAREGATFGQHMRGLLSTSGAITGVRTEYYGADGKLARAAEAPSPAPEPGLNTATMPSQVTCVASFLTGVPGRRYRGRIYLPALAPAFDADTLRLSPGAPPLIAQNVSDWLSAVAAAYGDGAAIVPAVYSGVAGTTTRITSVRVGDVLDTQRRRRDQLIETYSSAPVV